MGVGDLAHLAQRKGPSGDKGGDEICHGGGPVREGRLELPGMAPPSVADVDELGPSGAVALVVGEAVGPVDYDLVLQPLGVGKLGHLDGVGAGDTGRGLQDQPSG